MPDTPAAPARASNRVGSDAELLRRLLLLVHVAGMMAIVVELILLGHTEEPLQLVPLVALALALPVALQVLLRPSRRVVLAFRGLMVLFVAVGTVGLYAHLQSNLEFELEMQPTMRGLTLFWETATGAMPALSPGTMSWFGFLGIIATIRHPALR